MCRFQGVGPACGQPKDRGLSAAEKKEVLDYHNRFAPYQKIGMQKDGKRKDPKINSIEQDPEYVKFLENLEKGHEVLLMISR